MDKHSATTERTPKQQREIFFKKILSLTKHDIELRTIDHKTKKVTTRFMRTLEDIEDFVSFNLSKHLFFGVYSREGKGGKKENVREVASYFADLDFKSYQRGEAEARERLKAFEFHPSCVIHSGNGFHAYWSLDKVLEPSHKVEGILKGIAKHLGADTSVCELARVLRIPGTFNYKDKQKKPVSIIHLSDRTYSPELFDKYEETVSDEKRNNGNQELSAHIEEIKARCAFLKYCYENRENLPEPLWFPMVSNLARYKIRPIDLVHSFSQGFPGYSPRETEQKIKHCLNDSGPHTCTTIRQTMQDYIGLDCGKDCDAISPVVLLNRTEKKPSNRSMTLTRLSDLLNEPEDSVSWQVGGILPTGGFSVLASKPKTGKSTLARNLALCTAQGEPFLNREVNQGPVIYYALEEKRAEVKRHFKDMGATGEEEIYIYAGSAPLDALIQIRKITETIKPVLIIIDPLFRLTRVKDGNDYASVTQALEPILALARETGSHVLCVHHTGKSDRHGGDSVLGSTAIFSSVDTLVLMKRHEHYRTIQTIQRYGEDLEETTLHYDKERRTLEIGESKEKEDITAIEKTIIEFLFSQTEPVIEAVIMDEVEGRTGLKRKALREQVREGKIKRDGKGGKGSPFKYTCSLVPIIYGEQGNENLENDVTSDNQNKNACSHVFEENKKDDNLREQALGLDLEQQTIDLEDQNIEVIE